MKTFGGKYPIPGLHEQLKRGWERMTSAKDSKNAVQVLQKKEREALVSYKDLLENPGDEQTMQLLFGSMADATQNIVQLSDKLGPATGQEKAGLPVIGYSQFTLVDCYWRWGLLLLAATQ